MFYFLVISNNNGGRTESDSSIDSIIEIHDSIDVAQYNLEFLLISFELLTACTLKV